MMRLRMVSISPRRRRLELMPQQVLAEMEPEMEPLAAGMRQLRTAMIRAAVAVRRTSGF